MVFGIQETADALYRDDFKQPHNGFISEISVSKGDI